MKGKMVWTAALVTAATLAIGGLAYASSTQPALVRPVTIHVIEHATTDTVVDTGAHGDTTGDLLTFHNKVYNAADTKSVGRDQGSCIRIDPSAGSWECTWTTWIFGAPGSLTVEGPFYDKSNSTLAVTGGTRRFSNARGQMLLQSRANGTKFDFVFQLRP